MEKKERHSGIELLRILAAIGVIFLHYNNANIGGGLKYVASGSINELYLRLNETIFCSSVNIFMLISGYFLCDTRKIKSFKIVYLLAEVLFIRTSVYCFRVIFGMVAFSIKELIYAVLPTNYFVILYLAIYLISPYINLLLETLNEEQYKKMLLTFFLVFSVWSYGVDCLEKVLGGDINALSPIGMSGSQYGCTVVNFSLLYIIGAYIKRFKIQFDFKHLLIMAGSILALFFLSTFGARAWLYNNPLVIALATTIFLLFRNFKFYSKSINNLAGASLTCYIFHGYFIKYLNINFFVNQNIIVLILHQLVIGAVLYTFSFLVYKLFTISIGRLLTHINTNSEITGGV